VKVRAKAKGSLYCRGKKGEKLKKRFEKRRGRGGSRIDVLPRKKGRGFSLPGDKGEKGNVLCLLGKKKIASWSPKRGKEPSGLKKGGKERPPSQ